MKLTELAHSKGFSQTIAPAGAGRESLLLLLAAALTLVVSAAIVLARSQHWQAVSLAPYQIDLATALSADEQGLYTDLQTVYDELQQLKPSLPPPVHYWAQDGWPPFAAGLNAARRGAFRWQLIATDDFYAYLGRSEDGHELLWRLPLASFAHAWQGQTAPMDVWLRRDANHDSAHTAPALTDSTLIAHGWRQIAAHSNQLPHLSRNAPP